MGVLFLRFNPNELSEIINALKELLKNGESKFENKFVVVTTKKIRIREI